MTRIAVLSRMFEIFHNFFKSEAVAVTLSQLLAGAMERGGRRNAETEAGVGQGQGWAAAPVNTASEDGERQAVRVGCTAAPCWGLPR